MSASRNLGLRHASGAFVGFLDADDVWLPHKLDEQVGLLRAHPSAAMVYGRTQYWYGWTGRPEDLARDHELGFGLEPDRLVDPPALLLVLLRNEDQLPGPSDVLFRRRVLEEVGGFEEAFEGMFEDIVVLAKVALHAPVWIADRRWFRYRQHDRSCVARAEAEGAITPARLRVLEWLEGYLTRGGVGDRAVWRALRRELRPYRRPRLHAALVRLRRAGWRVRGSLWWLAGRVLPEPAYDWIRRKLGTVP
jgi:glycosyltransferase involved in cell wall biosynthesis